MTGPGPDNTTFAGLGPLSQEYINRLDWMLSMCQRVAGLSLGPGLIGHNLPGSILIDAPPPPMVADDLFPAKVLSNDGNGQYTVEELMPVVGGGLALRTDGASLPDPNSPSTYLPRRKVTAHDMRGFDLWQTDDTVIVYQKWDAVAHQMRYFTYTPFCTATEPVGLPDGQDIFRGHMYRDEQGNLNPWMVLPLPPGLCRHPLYDPDPLSEGGGGIGGDPLPEDWLNIGQGIADPEAGAALICYALGWMYRDADGDYNPWFAIEFCQNPDYPSPEDWAAGARPVADYTNAEAIEGAVMLALPGWMYADPNGRANPWSVLPVRGADGVGVTVTDGVLVISGSGGGGGGDNGIHGVKLDTDTFTRANNGIIELIEHSPTSAQVPIKFTLSDNGGDPDPIQVAAYIEKNDLPDPGDGDDAGDRIDRVYRILQKPSASVPETVVLDSTRDYRGRVIEIDWRSIDFDSTDDPDEELWPFSGFNSFPDTPGAAYTATNEQSGAIRAVMRLQINCTTGGGRLELVFTAATGGPQWTAYHIHVKASAQRSGAFDFTHEP